MALTIGQLREILKDPTITDDLPVTFVHAANQRYVADTAFGTAIVERDSKSHVPVTGRMTVEDPRVRTGQPERVFALYDR